MDIKNPRLPDIKVKCVLMSGEYSEFADMVGKLNIDVISSIPSKNLPKYERYHSDMQMHNCGYDTYFLKNDCSIYKKIILSKNKSAKVISEENTNDSNYPNNVSLNGTLIGEYFLTNINHCNKEMLSWYINNGIKPLNVKQGYAACSTAVIEYNAVITDDESVYNACADNKIDVLKISKGSIKLKGYSYGFIGGCCFKPDKKSICFFGNAQSHNDYKNIKDFCKNYKIDIISLGSGALTDIGGVIPII